MSHPKHFILLSDGFAFKGRQYRDSDIAHIYFRILHTVVKTNILLTTGETQTATLELNLKNGERVSISSEGGCAPQMLIFRDKVEERQGIIQVHQQIARRTFNSRLHFYLDQIETSGYFIYAGCRFYPHDKIDTGSREFRLLDTHFGMRGGYILMRPKSAGFFGKFFREFQVPIQTDTDVLFPILDKLFDLRWG